MADIGTFFRIQEKRARLDALMEKLGIQPGDPISTGATWPYYLYKNVATELRADPSLVKRPVTELAARFNTSPTTIYRALTEIGVQPVSEPGRHRRWRSRESSTDAVARHLLEHGTDDISDRALAEKLHVSRTTIRDARRDLGLAARPPGRPSRSPELDPTIIGMRDEDGASFSDIGEFLGMTRQGAQKRYRAAVARSSTGN